MRLGAALAVIRNNNEFNGLQNMLDTIFFFTERAKETYHERDRKL